MIESPCIKVCEFPDEICLGCGRSKAEIRGWKNRGTEERRSILAEADLRLQALQAEGRRRFR